MVTVSDFLLFSDRSGIALDAHTIGWCSEMKTKAEGGGMGEMHGAPSMIHCTHA